MDSNCNRLTILFTWAVTSVPTMEWIELYSIMLKKVWSSTDISNTTKLKVYETMC